MVVSRSQRITVVLSLAKREEDAAAARLGEIQRLLEQEQAQLAQLDDYLLEYRQAFNQRTQGLRGEDLAGFAGFTQRLKQAREAQRLRILQVQEQVEKTRATWHQKHHKRQSVADLVARLQREESAELERKLQKEMDEIVGQKFSRANL